MAIGKVFACSTCAHRIEAWDEGDPYYVDPQGRKHHAYHPSMERMMCVGIDSPTLCLACGKESASDSAEPLTCCPSCASGEIVSTWELDGRTCPYCRQGTFSADSNSFLIS